VHLVNLPTDIKAHNRDLIAQYRANGGASGRALLLLTTIGRRSGNAHTAPMMYVELDGRLLVIASSAGAPDHPDWYLNLLADPHVTVERDADAYAARAVPTTGADRDALFARIAAQFPFFTDHQAGVARTIPVVELVRGNG
jgi:deazaflavin-dependent oxidoreductase (nitroreductase family)